MASLINFFSLTAAAGTPDYSSHESYFIIVHILVPALFLYYGYRFWKTPPAFLKSDGYNTRRTRFSEAAWLYGQQAFGQFCFFSGVIVGICCALKYLVLDGVLPDAVLDGVYFGVEAVAIILAAPVTNLRMILRFGKDAKAPKK